MIVAIMQPTYLPWAGYFNLVARADCFVFLNDAQYEKGSWHNRNRVLVAGNPHWLTVPIRHGELTKTIAQTYVDDSRGWRSKQLRLIEHNYGRHPHAADLAPLLAIIGETSFDRLADLNVALIKSALTALGIGTETVCSSELGIPGFRTERLIAILSRLGAKRYLSPRGAAGYLAADQFTERTSIALEFQRYEPQPYTQWRQSRYESHLSILDVVANLGWRKAAAYITDEYSTSP